MIVNSIKACLDVARLKVDNEREKHVTYQWYTVCPRDILIGMMFDW